jgi:hypothetical protein
MPDLLSNEIKNFLILVPLFREAYFDYAGENGLGEKKHV